MAWRVILNSLNVIELYFTPYLNLTALPTALLRHTVVSNPTVGLLHCHFDTHDTAQSVRWFVTPVS